MWTINQLAFPRGFLCPTLESTVKVCDPKNIGLKLYDIDYFTRNVSIVKKLFWSKLFMLCRYYVVLYCIIDNLSTLIIR